MVLLFLLLLFLLGSELVAVPVIACPSGHIHCIYVCMYVCMYVYIYIELALANRCGW